MATSAGRKTVGVSRGLMMTLYYGGRTFQRLKGKGFKSGYFDVHSKEEYRISSPKRNGEDRLYGEPISIEIDADVREECWEKIRE